MKHLDSNILVLIFGVISGTGTTFLYCLIGSWTTEQFLLYGDRSYESEWYKLPIDQQKLMQIIIIDAQRPHVFSGFGIIDLNLMTYIKVRNTRLASVSEATIGPVGETQPIASITNNFRLFLWNQLNLPYSVQGIQKQTNV